MSWLASTTGVRRSASGQAAAFHLTDAGRELEPALIALAGWGVRYMTQPNDGDEFRSHWFAFPVSLFLHDSEPSGPSASIELRTTGRPAVIEASGGLVRTRLGSAPAPDVVLSGTPRLILGLLSGHLSPAEARDLGLEISGDIAVLRRLQRPAAEHPPEPRSVEVDVRDDL